MEEQSSLKDNDSKATNPNEIPVLLTQSQLERIEKNRQKALSLRQSRVVATSTKTTTTHQDTVIEIQKDTGNKHQLSEDTHGGFFLEEEEEDIGQPSRKKRLIYDEVPSFDDELPECEVCHKKFSTSFLWNKFKCSVCDQCRDSDDKYSLITKTEAKETFLLKDCDFEDRGGEPLPYLLKKNPHTSRGEMKLYMTSQVMERSYLLWGGEKGLDEEMKKREEAREKRKRKQYSKQIKNLRKAVYNPSSRQQVTHIHSYSEEQHNSSDDTWTKTCQECGHSITFEKL